MLLTAAPAAVAACSDDGDTETSTETGDPGDGDPSSGDGDGDPGDGDGDPTSGDGDGDPGDGDGDPGGLEGELICGLGSEPVGNWMRHTVADDLIGAAHIAIADFDGDGKQDLVSSSFGTLTIDGIMITVFAGSVHLHLQRDGLDCWERVELIGGDEGVYFPNEVSIADLDDDGDLDMVLAAGFFVCQFDPNVGACGGLHVLENRGDHFERHDLVTGDSSFYHRAALVDFDADGDLDLVTGRESNVGGQLVWHAGDGSVNFDPAAQIIDDAAGGTFPVIEDIDDDGDLDVAAARYFGADDQNPAYLWWERMGDDTFTRHTISADHGPGIKLELSRELYADGQLRAVATNHVNQGNMTPDAHESAVILMTPTDDPTQPWTTSLLSEGILSEPDLGLAIKDAPGVFELGDADNDGDLDVLLSGDGDRRTFWIELDGPGVSSTHVIEVDLAQAGGGHAVDLDADGDTDPVFTGYEDNVIYVYETQ